MDIVIYVDADAAPKDVVTEVLRQSQQFSASVVTISTVNHHFDLPNHVTLDAHPQAVDMEIVRRVQPTVPTVVVTQDYGLAALVLGKGARAVSVHGLEFTNNNIDRLLFERDINAKQRRSTGRSRGPKARTKEDVMRFQATLTAVLRDLQSRVK